MLIGIDASRAALAQRTGTENYALYLIRAMIAQGRAHRFRLYFNQRPASDLFVQSEQVEWRVIPFPRLWTHARLAWDVWRDPPDVLFVPSHVLPLVHPRRCVATVHDLGYLHYPQMHTPAARWYLDWSTRFNARVARRIIADSQATRDDLIHFYHTPADKIVVAYPAGVEDYAPVVDPQTLDRIRERYHTGRDYFLYVGTLQPRKNLETLIRAFSRLVAQGSLPTSVKLVLVGKRGWYYESLAELVRATALEERIVFTGYAPAKDLPALLSGAIAYVLPSWYEGFGLPVLEAMACQTPVICSNVSSLPEVAGDAALLFDPHSIEELAGMMRRLYKDEALRRELVRRGSGQVSRFSWRQCARQVLDALEAVETVHGRES